ncbi:hypothetical protein [Herbaspirillum sp.]|uniref:hypothetical protein n=1 Tax=Herbaspirillum sp. TaxID=1890675 RepID=UPI0031D2F935
MKRLVLKTLINAISRYPTGRPCPNITLGKIAGQPGDSVHQAGGRYSFSLSAPACPSVCPSALPPQWAERKIITILLSQFYHRRIATQLQTAGKNRLISIDLININKSNYGQLVAGVLSETSSFQVKLTKTAKKCG